MCLRNWCCASIAALVATACVDLVDPQVDDDAPTNTFIVRGNVTTGAHTRKPLANARVGILEPQGPNGGRWVQLGFGTTTADSTLTNADGSFAFVVDMSIFTERHTYPLYLAASDSAQTFTMFSELPADLATKGASLTIDINPQTTVAGELICPGGVSPPPQNSWCYSDPNAKPSASNSALITILERALEGPESSLEEGLPPEWSTFAAGFLNDPAMWDEIKNNLIGQGISLGDATPSSIVQMIASAPLPPVRPPPDDGSSSSGGTSSGGACRLVWDCGTSSQCATVYGGKTGSAAEPDLTTCQRICKSQGACTCQGC